MIVDDIRLAAHVDRLEIDRALTIVPNAEAMGRDDLAVAITWLEARGRSLLSSERVLVDDVARAEGGEA